MDEGTTVINIPNPLSISTGGESIKVDSATSAEKYQADIARTLFTNNDFTHSKYSAEKMAKIAVANAKIFWDVLPNEWKTAITGE